MDARLTYLSMISLAACILPSCTSDAPADDAAGAELSFAVSDPSRAQETPQIDEFLLFGDMKPDAADASEPIAIFSKTTVKHADGVWTYGATQYWVPNHDHSFVAVHPLSALQEAGSPRYSDSRLSFTYTIPSSADNALQSPGDVADIIAATHRRLFKEGDTASPVVLRFSHLMSKINLSPAFDDNVMTPQDFISINSVEVKGFRTSATFAVTPADRQTNSQTDDRLVEVGGQQGDGTMTVAFAQPTSIMNGAAGTALFGDNDAIIMIPQEIGSASGAEIRLTYTISGETETHSVSLPLAGQKWESGKSYNYRFTISRRGVTMEGITIADWSETDAGTVDAK